MGTLNRFTDKLIFVDTMPFIYHIEEHPVYVETGEVLVQPYRQGNDVLVAEYEGIICDTDGLLVVPIDQITSRKAARLRADHSLTMPDALQLATSLVNGANYFLTNDKGIAKTGLPQIILLDDLL